MFQTPLAIFLFPNMRVAEGIYDFRKFFFRHADIIQKFAKVSFWKFAVKSFYKRSAFVSGNMMVANFLRRVLRRPSVAEFNVGGVIKEAVSFIVYTVIF